MEIHYFYYIGRLLYSILSGRNVKFLILEITFIIISLILIFITFIPLQNYFLDQTKEYYEVNKILYAIVYFVIYFFPSLFARYLSNSHSPEQNTIANPKKPIGFYPSILTENKHLNKDGIKITVGIIDFAWLLLLSGAYCGLVYCQQFDVFKQPLLIGRSIEYYKIYYDEVKYLLGEAISLALILGTILGVCMTIIWSGSIWRKADPESIRTYKGTTQSATRMIIAFFIIVISEAVWIFVPLYLKLSSIKAYI